MSARRRLLRPGAWLALLALVSSLLAPLATDARAAALDEALSLAVCGSAGGAGPTEPAPPPGHHRGDPGCVNCLSGPAALPLLHDAGRVHATACTPLRIALRTAPPDPGLGPLAAAARTRAARAGLTHALRSPAGPGILPRPLRRAKP